MGFAPEFVTTPVGINVKEDENIEFVCQVSGDPTPATIWYHNGQPLELVERFSVSERDGQNVLQVTDVTLTDAGEYKVVATNTFGEASWFCALDVEGQ